jgi:hypothetical protein
MARMYVKGRVDLFRGLGKLSAESYAILEPDDICRHNVQVSLGTKFTKLFQAKKYFSDSNQIVYIYFASSKIIIHLT